VEQEDNASFEQSIRPNTRLIYIETPSNPILALTDLQFLGELGKKHKIVTMCDNTFATPLNQRPHDFGIDIILHSATKYLGGHSDLCAGVVCASEEWITKIWKRMLILGASLSSFDSWLLLKGLRTLSLRMRQINENAQQLAEWLSNDPRVNKVLYCGLPSHPQFELAKKQMKGFSGMLCMEVAGESDEIQLSNAQKVLNSVKIFANATSLGGVESLIVHPASMWGIKDFPEKQKQIGINNGMLRISVGIENIHDLIADLDQAMPAS
jgi:cystathionine beta-lyase/cystathionine gamma-synthase